MVSIFRKGPFQFLSVEGKAEYMREWRWVWSLKWLPIRQMFAESVLARWKRIETYWNTLISLKKTQHFCKKCIGTIAKPLQYFLIGFSCWDSKVRTIWLQKLTFILFLYAAMVSSKHRRRQPLNPRIRTSKIHFSKLWRVWVLWLEVLGSKAALLSSDIFSVVVEIWRSNVTPIIERPLPQFVQITLYMKSPWSSTSIAGSTFLFLFAVLRKDPARFIGNFFCGGN